MARGLPDELVARLNVLLTPRARRNAITALEADLGGGAGSGDAAARAVLRARVSAPPVDGRANTALERLVAAALDLPPSRVRVVAGHTSRRKQIEVEGLTAEAALAGLEAYIEGHSEGAEGLK